MQLTEAAQTEEEDTTPPPDEPKTVPPYGTIEWVHYWSVTEGPLPSPIDVSITGALRYHCPPVQWYNFDVYPHKVKMTNTGYTLLIGAKWKTERPYLEGGPFLDKHVISQIHFHWGSHMMEGSDHTVDGRRYPGEMQVTFFRSEYMTQEEALKHEDGVVMICYLIKPCGDGRVEYNMSPPLLFSRVSYEATKGLNYWRPGSSVLQRTIYHLLRSPTVGMLRIIN